MNAATYNRIRGIIFRTYNNPTKGPKLAKEYLERYRGELGPKGYVGLRAEIEFYERYRTDYGLTVAGDMGEHADFAGVLEGRAYRFDVATTLNFKTWDDYEPHLAQEIGYKIALLEHDTFKLVDVLDLGFSLCECGGHLIPCVTLLGQNYNHQGEPTLTNDQLLMDVCTNCHEYVERDRYSHTAMVSPQEMTEDLMSSPREMANAIDELNEEKMLAQSAVKDYAFSAYKYFRRKFDDRLMSVAQHEYVVTEPKGGGYWALQMVFVNQAVANEMPQEIECSHVW